MVDKMDQLGIFHNEEIKPLAYRARPTKLEDFVGQTFSIRIIPVSYTHLTAADE